MHAFNRLLFRWDTHPQQGTFRPTLVLALACVGLAVLGGGILWFARTITIEKDSGRPSPPVRGAESLVARVAPLRQPSLPLPAREGSTGNSGSSGESVSRKDIQKDFFSSGAPPPGLEGPASLGSRFLREPRDETWAPYAEEKLKNYVADLKSSGVFSPPAVECRSDICRVAVIADQAQLTRDQQRQWYAALQDAGAAAGWPTFSSAVNSVHTNISYPGFLGFEGYFVRATNGAEHN
jgi:hypothetical protein